MTKIKVKGHDKNTARNIVQCQSAQEIEANPGARVEYHKGKIRVFSARRNVEFSHE